MIDYERLTHYMQVGNEIVQVIPQRKARIQAYIDRSFDLEDKIESGELILKKEVEQLKTENTTLREKLDKALPCKVADEVCRFIRYADGTITVKSSTIKSITINNKGIKVEFKDQFYGGYIDMDKEK